MLWDQIKKIKNPNQEVRFLLLKSLKPFFLGKNDAKEPVTETESQNRVVDTTPSVGPKNTTKTELNDAAKIKILSQAGLANWYKLASKYARESQKFATMSFVEKLDFAIESFKKYNPNNNISMAQFKLLGDEVKGSLQENKENPHLEWLEKHDILKKVKKRRKDGYVTGDMYQFDAQHYDNPFIIDMVIAAAVNLYNNFPFTNVDLSKKQGDFDSLKACLKKSICDGTQINDLAALFEDLKGNKKESIGYLILRGQEQTTQKRQVNVARKKRAKRSPDKQQTLSIAATKLGEEQDQVTRFQVGRAAAKKCLDVASSSSRRRW